MSVPVMKRAIAMLGLMLALTGAFAGAARAADATPATVESMQALDGAILNELNATRAAHGLRPLTVSPQLEEAAVAHSREMLDGGFFAHDSPGGASFVQRLKRYYTASGYSSWSAGENLIYNNAQMDANEAIQVWLDSPPHRENMLDPTWREVGIGSLHAASAGGAFGGDPTWVITMDFGTRSGAVTAAKPAAAVKTVAAHKAVAATAKRAKKAEASKVTKVSKMVARVTRITKHLVEATPKAAFRPPTKPTAAKPAHKPRTKHAPETNTNGTGKNKNTGKDEGKPKSTPKKTAGPRAAGPRAERSKHPGSYEPRHGSNRQRRFRRDDAPSLRQRRGPVRTCLVVMRLRARGTVSTRGRS